MRLAVDNRPPACNRHQSCDKQQERRSEQQRRTRPLQQHQRITARQKHGAAKILLHHWPEYETDELRRGLETVEPHPKADQRNVQLQQEDIADEEADHQEAPEEAQMLLDDSRAGMPNSVRQKEAIAERDARPAHARSPKFNHAAVPAVCHRIMVHASLRAGAEGRARLRRIEAVNAAIGSL